MKSTYSGPLMIIPMMCETATLKNSLSRFVPHQLCNGIE